MYEITYLGENANYYHYYNVEANSREEAKEKFLAETNIEEWRIYSIAEIEEE